MKKKPLTLVTLSLCGLLASINASATSILVAHPITVGIAESLLKDTEVEILPAVPRNLPASRQLNYLENRGKEALADLSRKADAAIIVKSIFAQDYLYPLARRNNIRIVPIDIASPIDGEQSGVAKFSLNIDEHPVWLNPNGLAAMMMIFADESVKLDPQIKEKVNHNIETAQKRLRKIVNQMEDTLADIDSDPIIMVTDPALDYFVQGLQMQSYRADQDIAPEELEKMIKEKGINLVLSSKKFSAAQQKILSDAKVMSLKIERLKAEDPITQLEQNYEALTELVKTL